MKRGAFQELPRLEAGQAWLGHGLDVAAEADSGV